MFGLWFTGPSTPEEVTESEVVSRGIHGIEDEVWWTPGKMDIISRRSRRYCLIVLGSCILYLLQEVLPLLITPIRKTSN